MYDFLFLYSTRSTYIEQTAKMAPNLDSSLLIKFTWFLIFIKFFYHVIDILIDQKNISDMIKVDQALLHSLERYLNLKYTLCRFNTDETKAQVSTWSKLLEELLKLTL